MLQTTERERNTCQVSCTGTAIPRLLVSVTNPNSQAYIVCRPVKSLVKRPCRHFIDVQCFSSISK